ncbi:hypothetical protein [Alkalispirochaeta americana]|nr:hypothetical protein [Alkalispirochaeta americana]
MGCAPTDLHVPPVFENTPLQDDLDQEVRRSGTTLRVHFGWGDEPGEKGELRAHAFRRRPLFFLPRSNPALESSSATEGLRARGGVPPEGIALLPDPDRQEALRDALVWLQEGRDGPSLVVVLGESSLSPQELDSLALLAGESLLILEEDTDASRIVGEIVRRAIGNSDNSDNADEGGVTGLLVLGGANSAGVLRHLPEAFLREGLAVPEVVTESLFRATASRLRTAGLPLAGAIVLDLARALKEQVSRELPGKSGEIIYVPAVFYRY